MIQLGPITLGTSLQVAGGLFLLWIGQRLVDTLFSFAIDRRVFQPIYERIIRKIKIFRTRGDPVAAEFSLSFTPQDQVTVSEAKEYLKGGFEKAEQVGGSKISIEEQHWDVDEREGIVNIHYSDRRERFDVSLTLVPDTQSLRETPSEDPEKLLVGSIGLDISFDFPFHLLEDTLFNLGSLLNYIEDGFENQMRGSFSGGRFVISPVETGLTLDEWIENEKFDISLLLATEGEDRTEVEFFRHKAVVKSTQREIDAQTVKYVRELLLNYYL